MAIKVYTPLSANSAEQLEDKLSVCSIRLMILNRLSIRPISAEDNSYLLISAIDLYLLLESDTSS